MRSHHAMGTSKPVYLKCIIQCCKVKDVHTNLFSRLLQMCCTNTTGWINIFNIVLLFFFSFKIQYYFVHFHKDETTNI